MKINRMITINKIMKMIKKINKKNQKKNKNNLYNLYKVNQWYRKILNKSIKLN